MQWRRIQERDDGGREHHCGTRVEMGIIAKNEAISFNAS